MKPGPFDIRLLAPGVASAFVGPVLRSVPEWFGIEESTQMYIRKAGQLPTWGAVAEGAPAGFVTIARPFPESADVYCMAVARAMHRRGVGSALLAHVEDALRRDGVKYLQVKTQGPSKPCAEYARTLEFYRHAGFARLEEVRGLWPGLPCLILVKSLNARE